MLNFQEKMIEISHHFLHLPDEKIQKMAKEFYAHPLTFKWWIEETFRPWIESNINPPVIEPSMKGKTLMHIMASNSFAHMVTSLAFGKFIGCTKQIVKAPTGCGSFLQEWTSQWNEINVGTWKPDDQEFQEKINDPEIRLFVYGNQSTINIFKDRPKTFLFGPQWSIAILTLDELDDDLACSKMAKDVQMFDLKGCLSPHVIFVQKPSDLSKIIDRLKNYKKFIQYPRGAFFPGEFDSLYRLQTSYDFTGVCIRESHFNIGYACDTSWPQIFLPRFLHVRVFNQIQDIQPILDTNSIAQIGAITAQVSLLDLRKGEKIVPLGMMQTPNPWDTLLSIYNFTKNIF